MNPSLNFAQKLSIAYGAACKPLCHELNLPQTAFDILMFLANNPNYRTASDIVEARKLKANLVSVNINRLVQEGYLKRESTEYDRRKTLLTCTAKAQPIIERGHIVQTAFVEGLFENIDEQAKKAFFETMNTVEKNLDAILERSY